MPLLSTSLRELLSSLGVCHCVEHQCQICVLLSDLKLHASVVSASKRHSICPLVLANSWLHQDDELLSTLNSLALFFGLSRTISWSLFNLSTFMKERAILTVALMLLYLYNLVLGSQRSYLVPPYISLMLKTFFLPNLGLVGRDLKAYSRQRLARVDRLILQMKRCFRSVYADLASEKEEAFSKVNWPWNSWVYLGWQFPKYLSFQKGFYLQVLKSFN